MKQFLLPLSFLLFFDYVQSAAQENNRAGLPEKIAILSSLEKPGIVIYKTTSNDFFFAKKDGKTWVSWEFKKATLYPSEKFEMLARQIDEKGKPEILISWKNERSEEYEGETGGNHSKHEFMEIWNIDTQTALFSAMTYKEESNTIDMTEKRCHYSYDFIFNSLGELILSKLQKTGTNCIDNQPDHAMGKYVFDGKQFVKKK